MSSKGNYRGICVVGGFEIFGSTQRKGGEGIPAISKPSCLIQADSDTTQHQFHPGIAVLPGCGRSSPHKVEFRLNFLVNNLKKDYPVSV